MVTLSIYLDESSSEHPYVAGGWAMQPNDWNSFSEKWRAGLDAEPSIPYFKLNEALGCKESFAGWSVGKSDSKTVSLAKIIANEKTLFATGCYLHRKDFEAQKHLVKRKIYRDPYYFCIAATMLFSVYGEFRIVGFDKIDFILDQSNEAERMRRLYYSHIKPRFGRLGECITLDDQETFPLQAADYLAGCLRQQYEENSRRIPGSYALTSGKLFSSVIEFHSKGIAEAIAHPIFSDTS